MPQFLFKKKSTKIEIILQNINTMKPLLSMAKLWVLAINIKETVWYLNAENNGDNINVLALHRTISK